MLYIESLRPGYVVSMGGDREMVHCEVDARMRTVEREVQIDAYLSKAELVELGDFLGRVAARIKRETGQVLAK